MKGSSSNSGCHFKSPAKVLVRVLLRSRELIRSKYRELLEFANRSNRRIQSLTKRCEALEEEKRELTATVMRLERERYERLEDAARILPPDPPIGSHGYGPRMVELSIRLARIVGFRSTTRVMEICFEWLGIKQLVPHFTAIRTWLQRLGVAAMQEPLEKADDWIWMADHSNQIGQEKILVVLAIRASRLPPPGKALQLGDMRVLTVRPGKSWKREDVARVYADLAAEHGAPRQILSDGAVELRDSAAPLKIQRADCITLQDFKHKAANFLEAALRQDKRFTEFTAQVGSTRAAIQQTELAHLTPPSLKTKARFMNLGPLLAWGTMVLWLLRHSEAKSRRWMTSHRLEEKLGWLRTFEADLAVWDEYQQVIQRGLKFINTQGVFRGASDQLRQILDADLKQTPSRELADRLVTFVKDAESQVKEGERLPLSTEILESSFARYKRLEGQHAKGGFTSLVATFAGLLFNPTSKSIKQKLSTVSTKAAQEWVQKHLDTTVTSKRTATYQEMKQSTGRNKKRHTNSVTNTATII